MTKLIVYAYPTGPLADQIHAFFAESKRRIGRNEAHDYPPHCTLTGFFADAPTKIPEYVAVLEETLDRARSSSSHPRITVADMLLEDTFYRLTIVSEWLAELAVEFAHRGKLLSPATPIRPKPERAKGETGLHLSLAYRFPEEQSAPLTKLALEMVDPRAPVGWELRFYERQPDRNWTARAVWPIGE